MNNFTLRAISGFFYAITVVACILLSPTTLAMLMFVIAFFCAFEWARIHDANKPSAMGFGVYTWLFLSPFVTNFTPLQAAGIAAIIALWSLLAYALNWLGHRLRVRFGLPEELPQHPRTWDLVRFALRKLGPWLVALVFTVYLSFVLPPSLGKSLAMVLAFEPTDPGVMRRAPRPHRAQPLGHPPDAQGAARGAGQPCAAKGQFGQCRAHPF